MVTVEGKVVVVTGAAGGIGVAIARDLYEEGATVIATARKKDQVDELAAAYSDERWNAVQLDVTGAEEFAEVIGNVVSQFGRLDGLVNNAGVLAPNDVPSSSLEEYALHFDVNVKRRLPGLQVRHPGDVAERRRVNRQLRLDQLAGCRTAASPLHGL